MTTEAEFAAMEAKVKSQIAAAEAAASGSPNASAMVSNIQSGLKDQLGAAASLMDPSKLTGMVGNLQNQASQIMGSIAGEASSLLGSSLSQITSAFPDAAKDLFGTLNTDVGSLLNKATDSIKGLKEVNSKIESLASDAAAAIANPVAFISKPLNDVMKGLSTMANGMGVKDALSGLGADALSNLGKAVGFSIDSGSDFTKALNSITGDLSSKIGSVTSSISSMVSSVVAPVTSTISSFAGSLVSGISSTVGSIAKSTGLSSIISAGSSVLTAGAELASAALNALPAPLRSTVSSLATSFVASKATELLGGNLSSFTNAYRLLSNTSQKDNILGAVLQLSGSSNYSTLTTTSGQPLTSQLGNNTSTDLAAFYKAAQTLCSSIQQPESINYRNNKDLFDILMQLGAEMGMTDLMKQLQKCLGGESTSYSDSRTTSILQTSSYSAALQGNTSMYGTILDIIGAANMRNSKQEVIVLNSNMKGTQSNITEYNRILKTLGYSSSDLVYNQYNGVQAISGTAAVLMSATNTKIVDDLLGSDTRKLVQGAIALFA